MAHLARSVAALRIFGDDLEPDEITRLLGCPPTKAQVKGQVTVGKTGRQRVARTGSWHLEAQEAEPENLDAQIVEIFGKLTSDSAVWVGIGGRYSVDLFCGLFMESWNEGLSLSPESMRTLGARGVEIGLDIYAPTESGEDDA